MKQGKVTGIILAFLNMILIVACVVFYLGMDRTEPKLEFQATELIYSEGMEETGLLEGVKAYDGKDGDITDRIVIEKTIENREEGTIVVFYAVSDRAGNVAKASRIFNAVYAEKSNKDSALDQFMEAGINAELNQDYETDNNEVEDRESSEAEALEEVIPDPVEEQIPEPAELPTPTPAATPQPTPEPTPKPRPTADPFAPVLTLKVSEVKVNAGQGPAWVDIIGTLTDDKDNYETLFKNLSVSKYDMNKPGTYQVTVSTEDSDGNQSGSVPLTIVVK